MSINLADIFPVARKWPPQHPERLQLYAESTPNARKLAVMLEETGLPYETHCLSFARQEQLSPEFLALNPYGKIPAIIDPDGPGGAPLALFESGAILLYLAGKTGQLLPRDPVARQHTIQWLMWQMAGVGPMFGQINYFYVGDGRAIEDKRALDRFAAESRRLLAALETQLAGRRWIIGEDYTIADIAVFPWLNSLINIYHAGPLVGYQDFGNVQRVFDQFLARPAVQRGMVVCR